MYPLLKDHANQRVGLRFFESSDHITPKTDVNPGTATVTVAKAGGNLQASSAVLSAHQGGGFYWLTLPAADLDTVGQMVIRVETAGADDAFAQVWVREIQESQLYDLIESQRGTHAGISRMFYWDPINGDDANDSLTRQTPRKTFASLYTLVEAYRHDIMILMPGQPSGETIITEQINLSKAFSFLRGPGRDVVFRPLSSGQSTIIMSALGIELSGVIAETFTGGSDSSIKVTADFCRMRNVWSDFSMGNGIELVGAGYTRMEKVFVRQAGQSGVGSGLVIDGSIQAAKRNFITGSSFSESNEHGVNIKGVNAQYNTIEDSAITSNGGYGVQEESAADFNLVRNSVFKNNTSGETSFVGAGSRVENIGDIAAKSAEKMMATVMGDGIHAAGTFGYWFYKIKQYFLNRRDAGVTSPGEETVYQDDDVSISMSGAMKKSSGASWTPPTEGVAQKDRMT